MYWEGYPFVPSSSPTLDNEPRMTHSTHDRNSRVVTLKRFERGTEWNGQWLVVRDELTCYVEVREVA